MFLLDSSASSSGSFIRRFLLSPGENTTTHQRVQVSRLCNELVTLGVFVERLACNQLAPQDSGPFRRRVRPFGVSCRKGHEVSRRHQLPESVTRRTLFTASVVRISSETATPSVVTEPSE